MEIDIRDILPSIYAPTLIVNSTMTRFSPIEGAISGRADPERPVVRATRVARTSRPHGRSSR